VGDREIKNRVFREERRVETMLQSELKHIVKRHFHINTNKVVFPACCCSCGYEFMNECLHVGMIWCRCMLGVHLQVIGRFSYL
jgi:predicted Zn-ribbon and HTH transcriptional regulator